MRNMFFMLRVAVIAALAFAVPASLHAQVVTRLPIYTGNNPNTVTDLGNGPTEIRILQGNAQIFTAQSSGAASTSGSSTTLTLASTPTTANAPCVGCIVSSTLITSGTTVVSYNGGLTVVLSAVATVAAGSPVAWGTACPSTIGSTPAILAQAGVGADLPLYTQSRICTSGQNTVGASLLQFPIGAH